VSRVDALQDVLAAEHAAVYVLGYLGAQTSASARPELFATIDEAYEVHRSRRDDVAAAVRGEGADPTPAAPAYEVPDVGGDPGRVERTALVVERRCASAYRFLVGSSEGAGRRAALDLLLDSAVRALALGGSPEDLPGT